MVALESSSKKAKAEAVAHISKINFERVAKPVAREYDEVENCKGAQLREYNFDVEAPIIHLLVHWILCRNPNIAFKYALGDKIFDNSSVDNVDELDGHHQAFLVEFINFFANEDAFKPVINNILISCFAECLKAENQKGKIKLAKM